MGERRTTAFNRASAITKLIVVVATVVVSLLATFSEKFRGTEIYSVSTRHALRMHAATLWELHPVTSMGLASH
jgi:hypothetical protein